jgi:hypothetical protein
MSKLDLFYNNNANIAAFGGIGFRVLNAGDSLPLGEEAYALLSLDNAVVETINTNPKGDLNFDAILYSGIMIYGNFVSVTVSAGSLMAYLK